MAIFEITFLFLGSIIGAGFATGAEIVTFFGNLDLPVWLIAITVGLCMFTIISLEIFLHYSKHKSSKQINIQPTTSNFVNKSQIATKFPDIVFVMIYLILFTAMTAGITQITNQITCIFSLVISIIIVLFSFQKLTKINSYIVITIIILIITTTLPHLSFNQFTTINFNHSKKDLFLVILWAFFYAGLNCFMFPELINAFATKYKRHTLIIASAIATTLVTILIGLILTTIKTTNTENTAIPLLAIAPNRITILIILFAILTSQYTALFAIIQRIQKLFPNTKNKPQSVAIVVCLCAFIGSFCGFKQIIQYAYPIIGAFTCFYLLFSWLKFWLSWSISRHHQ